jgi:beta-N-acetylhexosaminidase
VAFEAVHAGVDLLLFGQPDFTGFHLQSLNRFRDQGLLDGEELLASNRRIMALKEWLGKQLHSQDWRSSAAGAPEVADQIASNRSPWYEIAWPDPLRPPADQRIAVLIPKPLDLTPADASSYVVPTLLGKRAGISQ